MADDKDPKLSTKTNAEAAAEGLEFKPTMDDPGPTAEPDIAGVEKKKKADKEDTEGSPEEPAGAKVKPSKESK